MSLVIVNAVGLITVQDRGRPGRMHEALPPGGALVPSLLARANRLVGNAVGSDTDPAGIEICGQLVVRAERDQRIATDREVHDLRAGDELAIASGPHRVTYLAVLGGIDAPVVLGGRGAHLSAAIGALLRAGDVIAGSTSPAASTAPSSSASSSAASTTLAIRVVPGPDLDAFGPGALDALVTSAWRLSPASDRVGTRLEGPTIERRADYEERSRPLVIGAIEVPRDGAPIVLGPEHPTTGGYPVLAVVATESLDAFHAIGLGRAVHFRV